VETISRIGKLSQRDAAEREHNSALAAEYTKQIRGEQAAQATQLALMDGHAQGMKEGEMGILQKLQNYFGGGGGGLAQAGAVNPELDYYKQQDMRDYQANEGAYR